MCPFLRSAQTFPRWRLEGRPLTFTFRVTEQPSAIPTATHLHTISDERREKAAETVAKLRHMRFICRMGWQGYIKMLEKQQRHRRGEFYLQSKGGERRTDRMQMCLMRRLLKTAMLCQRRGPATMSSGQPEDTQMQAPTTSHTNSA